MKNVIAILLGMMQLNAWAMGSSPQEEPKPKPSPTPIVIPPGPGFSDEEVDEFIRSKDFYIHKPLLKMSSYEVSGTTPLLGARFFARCGGDCPTLIDPMLRADALTGFRLVSASKDGSKYVLEAEIRSPILPSLLANRDRSLFFRFEGALESCDGVPLGRSARVDDLKSAIENLHGIDFKSFYSCSLALQLQAASSEPTPEKDLDFTGVRSTGPLTIPGSGFSLSVNLYQNGQADFNFGREREKVLTNRSPFRGSPESRKAAIASAKEFVRLIKTHGIEIAKYAMAKNLSERERQLALAQSLVQKKEELMSALRGVNENFSKLELVDRLSIAKAIGDAYRSVRSLEGTAHLTPDYSLVLELNPFILGD